MNYIISYSLFLRHLKTLVSYHFITLFMENFEIETKSDISNI